ncbi:MAG: hemolysin family protein [Pirellulales bacterium]|nr:hemolysin family protein [Pirellulales bacterium]
MNTTQLFWTSLLALAATAFASLGVRALRNFSRHDLEEICRRRGQPERFSQVLRLHETVALGVEMLAILLAVIAVLASFHWAIQEWQFSATDSWSALLLMSAGLGLVLAVATTWIPWATSRVFAESFLFYTWPMWKAFGRLATPLVLGAKLLDIILHRLAGRVPQSVDEETIEEEIRAIVTEGHREGLLEEDAREMIEGVIELGDADVSEIMTPRTDMHMVQIDTPWDEIVADVIEAGHTRIPVYGSNRDDILGVLYSKDLLPELATGDPNSRTPIQDLLRKPLFVPETKPLDQLLEMFQQVRTHIALVLDEYGGVAGLVTIEDILEEIVGEIVDEYDEELAQEIERIDEVTCEALGRAHVDEINTAMKLELPEDGDFDTIGGFVFTELGRVPLPGETLVWQDQVRIQVLEASKRRIDRVRIRRLDDDQLESA